MSYKLEKMMGPSKPVEFFGLLASWLFASFCPFTDVPAAPDARVLWLVLASWCSLIALDWIGFFELHIPKPELSGFLSLLLALPVSAFLAKWLQTAALQAAPVGNAKALRDALVAALVFGTAHELIFRLHRAMGGQWTLLTRLHPDDLEDLRVQIEDPRTSRWIRVRPLEAAPARGRGMRGKGAVVISRRSADNLLDCSELIAAHLDGKNIVDLPQLVKELRGRVDLNNPDGWSFLLTSTPQNLRIRLYFHMKTALEPVLALALLILLLPFLAVVALAVLWTNGRPILYAQERAGYRGKPFTIYKFRTMSNSAEKTGAQWALRDDPRVTPLGRWLRRTRIDELPQLFNVVRGDLGFVGPRPERPEFYELLRSQVPLFSMRLLVRPGITGWAQVRQGYAASVEECRIKLEYDLYYVQNMSHKLDLRVLVQTTAMMMRGSSGR